MIINHIQSVCCDAPVRLVPNEVDFMTLTMSARCCQCLIEVAGIGLYEMDSDIRRVVTVP